MRWSDIQTRLVEAMEMAAGVGIKASWNRRESAWRAKKFIKLDVLNIERVGHTEILRVYDSDEDKLVEVARNLHVLVVQVSAESQSQELADTALAIASRVRSRLALAEVRALIEDAGLAVATAGTIVNTSYVDPSDVGRHVSRATFDLRLNVTSDEVASVLTDYIDSVSVRGEVYDPGAVVGEDPPRLVVEGEIDAHN